MPTIREVHDAFERLIAEQEQLSRRLHDEANSLNQSATEAVEGVQGTIAEVARSVIVDEASLTMLAAEGEPAPLDRLREVRAANERTLTEARQQLNDAAGAEHLLLLSERMLAAQAAERRARSEAEALMRRMAPILPAIASDHDATIRKITAHLASSRLRRLIDKEGRQIREAAAAYTARLGHDLMQDAHTYAAQREKEVEQASLFRDVAEAADAERRRLNDVIRHTTADIEAVTSFAGQAAPFNAALTCAETVCLKRAGAIALRSVAGERLPAAALAELVRADRLRELARGLEQRVAGVIAFRDKLTPHMSKLSRGRRLAPSKAVNIDLADLEGKWAAMKAGLESGREAMAAMRAIDGELGSAWFDAHAARAGATIANGGHDSWWDTIGILYILNAIGEQPHAAPAAAMFPDLSPDAIHAVCHHLAPELAASLAECRLPDAGGHVPHTSIDVPGASSHAAVALPDAGDIHHALSAASAINVDVAVTVDVPSVSVDVPDFSVHVPDITVDVSVSSFDGGHSHSF